MHPPGVVGCALNLCACLLGKLEAGQHVHRVSWQMLLEQKLAVDVAYCIAIFAQPEKTELSTRRASQIEHALKWLCGNVDSRCCSKMHTPNDRTMMINPYLLVGCIALGNGCKGSLSLEAGESALADTTNPLVAISTSITH